VRTIRNIQIHFVDKMLLLLIWRYSPLQALAFLITALQLSLSCAFFHQADPSDISEALIQGFLTVYVFYRDEVVSLMPQPPTWRTRISLLVCPITFDPSGM
jgi:hypothetical protein